MKSLILWTTTFVNIFDIFWQFFSKQPADCKLIIVWTHLAAARWYANTLPFSGTTLVTVESFSLSLVPNTAKRVYGANTAHVFHDFSRAVSRMHRTDWALNWLDLASDLYRFCGCFLGKAWTSVQCLRKRCLTSELEYILTHEIKRDRVAYSKSLLKICDTCDPKVSPWSRYWWGNMCTTMNLREQQRAEHGCPMEEARLKSQKKTISEESTVHDILNSKRNRAAKTTWRGKECHWEILQRYLKRPLTLVSQTKGSNPRLVLRLFGDRSWPLVSGCLRKATTAVCYTSNSQSRETWGRGGRYFTRYAVTTRMIHMSPPLAVSLIPLSAKSVPVSYTHLTLPTTAEV